MENTIPDTEEEVTAEAFNLWVKNARPGERFTYHTGHLSVDREKIVNLPQYGSLAHVMIEPYHSVGQAAYRAYEQGKVELIQKRLSRSGRWAYIAIKRRVRTAVTWRHTDG
jgi:hypothetical protein